MQCPSCKQEVPQSRFCGNCGAPMAAVAPSPNAITTFGDGRYRVERKLGEGGKGIVFLCQDTVLGRKVAVKLIKDQEMDEDALARFQREVQAMAALVHPNVVTIFDIGREPLPQPSPVAGEGGRGGRYYLVLELMEGGDVEHLISRAPNKRLDAATAIRVTSEAARGLAHAHGHGILHRDIKPGNIWLTKEGFAKLGDFGLAYLNQGAKLTRAGMMVGTVAYMAPELALGRQADARSDLYMLGGALYEMVTGRLPFPGDDPVRMIFSHINDLPPAPKRFAPDLPDALERLVMRLLAKDPEQRPASANEVIQALGDLSPSRPSLRNGEREVVSPLPVREGGQGVRSVGTGGGTPPLQPQGEHIGSPLRQTVSPAPTYARPLVGRDRERDALRARLDAAMQGQGGLVFLTGEAGIGKTRLAKELRSYARQRGVQWLEGRYEKDSGIPGQPYLEAIRQYLRSAPRGAVAQHVGQYAAELSRAYPDIAAALGTRVTPSTNLDASAIQEDPQGARQRQLDAVCHFFTSIAHDPDKPGLVYFLDDLQWSPSMDYLQALAQRAQTEPLLLVGAYRETELDNVQALTRTVLAMNRLRLFQAMPLHRLNREQVADMVRQALGQPPSEQLVDLLYQRTQGNPFFVEELVRHLVETGALSKGDKGWDVKDTPSLQMPRSVKVLVEEKLERLSEGTRTMLAMASVIGSEFDLPLLKEVTGLDDDALLTAVEEALDTRILIPKAGIGRESYAFADNQVRESLYDGISAIRRRRNHLRVGQAIEKVHARRLEEHYGALANHFIQGNDTEKAADYSIKAGDAAYARATFPRAMEHYRIAAELLEELGEETERAAHVYERLGSNLSVGYAIQEVSAYAGTPSAEAAQSDLAHAERAIALYTKLGRRRQAAVLHRILGASLSGGTGGIRRDIDLSHKHYEAAVEALGDEPASLEKVVAYFGSYYSNSIRHDLDIAETRAREALGCAESLRDDAALSQGHLAVGMVLAARGKLKEGLAHGEAAYQAARRSPPHWFLPQVTQYHFGLFNVPWAGDIPFYLKWAERHRELVGRSGGNRYRGSEASVTVGVLAYSGQGEQARTRLGEMGVVVWLARVLLVLGEWEDLGGRLASQLAQSFPERSQRGLLAAKGKLLLCKGEYGEGAALLAEQAAAYNKAGFVTNELTVLPDVVIAYTRLGQLEDAHKALARAQEILASAEEWLGLPAYVYHAEGVLAAAEGRFSQAEAAFRRAADTSLAHGVVYDQGQALYDWAVMYLDRGIGHTGIEHRGTGETGNRAYGQTGIGTAGIGHRAESIGTAEALALRNRGQDLLDQALAIFRRCDAKKDIEKCLARKERLTA